MLIDFVALSFPEIPPSLFTIPRLELGGIGLGPIPLRFYSLSYMVGLVIGLFYTYELVKRPQLYGGAQPVKKDDLEELFFWLILGMILGGRIGYVLFYLMPFTPEVVLNNPITIIRIWDGGLSFHGGLLGVSAAMVGVAIARKVPLFSLTDTVAVPVPIIIALVRCANFINAELYGRPTDSAIGMTFPEGNAGANAMGPPQAWDAVNKEWVYSGLEVPRHPSQLYEAATEGVLLAIILTVMVWRFKLLRRPGLVTGVFLIGYAIARTFSENFREPDAHIGYLFGGSITQGMILSFFMLLAGGVIIYLSSKKPPLAAAE